MTRTFSCGNGTTVKLPHIYSKAQQMELVQRKVKKPKSAHKIGVALSISFEFDARMYLPFNCTVRTHDNV